MNIKLKFGILFLFASIINVFGNEKSNYYTYHSFNTSEENPEWYAFDGIDNTGWKINENEKDGWFEYSFDKPELLKSITLNCNIEEYNSLEIFLNSGNGYRSLCEIKGAFDGRKEIYVSENEGYVGSLLLYLKGNNNVCMSVVYEVDIETRDESLFGKEEIQSVEENKIGRYKKEIVYNFCEEVELKVIKSQKFLNYRKIRYWNGESWERLNIKKNFFNIISDLWNRYEILDNIKTSKVKIEEMDLSLSFIELGTEFWGYGIKPKNGIYPVFEDDVNKKFCVIENLEEKIYYFEIYSEENYDLIKVLINGRQTVLKKSALNKNLYVAELSIQNTKKNGKNLYLELDADYSIKYARFVEKNSNGKINVQSYEIKDSSINQLPFEYECNINLGRFYSLEKIKYEGDFSGRVFIHDEYSYFGWKEIEIYQNDGSSASLYGIETDKIKIIASDINWNDFSFWGSECTLRKEIRNESVPHAFVAQSDDFEVVSEDGFIINGRVMYPIKSVSINGNPVSIDRYGGFEEKVVPAKGYSSVVVQFFDRFHNKIGDNFVKNVYRYSTSPSIKMDSPFGEVLTNREKIKISGRIGNIENGKVLLNGKQIEQKENCFYSEVELKEGENNFTVEVFDEFGRSSKKQIKIKRDTIEPTVEIKYPQESTIISGGLLDFVLKSAGEEAFWYKITSDGEWYFNYGDECKRIISLEDGYYNWNVFVKDIAGNKVESEYFTFCMDNTPPEEFSITSDISGWSNNNEPTIFFETNDLTSGMEGYYVKLDDGIFNEAVSPVKMSKLNDGEHVVTVKAVDKAGNSRLSTIVLKIDTSKPYIPGNFHLISGSSLSRVEWVSVNDGEKYQEVWAERNPAFPEGARLLKTITATEGYGFCSYDDVNLGAREIYSYRLYSKDRAGNTSDKTDWYSIETNCGKAKIVKGKETVLEYDGIKILIKPDSVLEDITKLQIQEIPEEALFETITDSLGKYFRILGIREESGSEIICEHVTLVEPAEIECKYENSETLKLNEIKGAWYDTTFGWWQDIQKTYIDKKNETAIFYTNHFTDFTVHATKAKDISPIDVRDEVASFTNKELVHSEFNVSPQTGAASISFVEKVLPGKNNLNLTLSRIYSSAVAHQDAFRESEKEDEKDKEYLDGSESWKIANGWRLQFPYMKRSSENLWFMDNTGNLVSVNQLKKIIKITEGTVFLENHESGDSTVEIGFQTKKDIEAFVKGVLFSTRKSTKITHLNVYGKDGSCISYDDRGRVISITDETGTNSIKFQYSDGKNVITDSMGRIIECRKDKGLIKKIDISKGEEKFTKPIEYTTENKLLTKATDLLGRNWEYNYKEYNVTSSSHFVVEEGDDELTDEEKEIEEKSEKTINVSLLNVVRCNGFGEYKVEYQKVRLEESKNAGRRILKSKYSQFRVKKYGKAQDGNFLEETLCSYETEYNGQYVNKAVFYNKRLKVEYFFANIVKSRSILTKYDRNLIESVFKVRYELNNDSTEVIPILTNAVYYDSNNSEIIYSEINRWDDDCIRLNEKLVEYDKENYEQHIYKYDDWGNIVSESFDSLRNEEREKSLIEREFNKQTAENNIPEIQEYDSKENYINGRYKKDYLTFEKINVMNWYGDFIEDGKEKTDVRIRLFKYGKLNKVSRILEKVEDNKWKIIDYEYDKNGLVSKESVYGNDSGEKNITEYEHIYDSTEDYKTGINTKKNLLIKTEKNVLLEVEKEAKDIKTISMYSPLTGYLIAEVDASENVTKFEYDVAGRIVKRIKPVTENGILPVLTVEYDDAIADSYDASKQLTTTVTEENNLKTVYHFDNFGRLIKSEKGNIVIDFEYDVYNQLIKQCGPYSDGKDSRTKENIVTKYAYDSLGRVISVRKPGNKETQKVLHEYNSVLNSDIETDEDGRKVRTSKNFRGDVTKKEVWLYGNWQKSSTRYNVSGNVIYEKDFNGNVKRYFYNELGKIKLEQGAEGNFNIDGKLIIPETVYKYDSKGNLKEILKYENCNSQRRLISRLENTVINSRGQILESKTSVTVNNEQKTLIQRNVYDELGNKIAVLSGYENEELTRKLFKYDIDHRLIYEEDEEGNYEKITYDVMGNMTSKQDSRELNDTYEGTFKLEMKYDEYNRLVEANLPQRNKKSEKLVKKYKYDSAGNCVQEIDVDGSVKEIVYNENGLPLKFIEKGETADSVTRKEYTAAGREKTVIYPAGNKLEKKYDEAGRLVEEKNSRGAKTYSYDLNGNLLSEKDFNGNETRYTYTSQNKIRTKEDSLGGKIEFRYDFNGNLVSQKDNEGNVFVSEYDEIQRLVKETDNFGHSSNYEYDSHGNLTKYVDRNGTVFTRNYTKNGLMTEENGIGSNGITTRKTIDYDEVGNIKKVTEDGITTSYNMLDGVYQSDPYNFVTSKNTQGVSVQYSYDNKNLLESVKTPDGTEVKYSRNVLNEITGIDGWIKNCEYYSDKLLKDYETQSGIQVKREYDSERNLSKLTYSQNSIVLDQYDYAYDDIFNLIRKNKNTYTYDSLNRLCGVYECDGKYEKNPDENDKKLYEALKDVGANKDGEVLLTGQEEVIFDAGAKSIIADFGTEQLISKIKISPNYKVTRVYADDVSLYIRSEDGDWRPITNCGKKKNERDGSITIILNKHEMGRYVKVHNLYDERTYGNEIDISRSNFKNSAEKIIQITTVGSVLDESYAYDSISNRTVYVRNHKIYNIEYYKNSTGGNSSLVKNDGIYEYLYDKNGNRIAKVGNGETWKYTWDLRNRLIKVEMETNGNKLVEVSYKYDHENNKLTRECDGNVTYYMYDLEGKLLYEKNDTVCRSYVYMQSRLVGFYEDEKQYYAITDETGSVRKIYEGDSEVWCGTYSPFGKLMSHEGELEITALYAGKEIDSETGLTYHWNRWRNEDGNAFISEDPLRDGYNWYGYANANPFRYVDSNGLESYVCRDGTFCSEGDLSNPSYRADCYYYNGYNSGTLASMSTSAYSLYNNVGQATLALTWTSATSPSAAEEIKNCGNIGVENVIRGKIADAVVLLENKDEVNERITELVVGDVSTKLTIQIDEYTDAQKSLIFSIIRKATKQEPIDIIDKFNSTHPDTLLNENILCTLFSNPDKSKALLLEREEFHKDLRYILNGESPFNEKEAKKAEMIKLPWYKSIFHNPFKNNKYISVDGHLEGVYDKKTGRSDNNKYVMATFNFFDPNTQPELHKKCDVDPYIKWGN